MLITSGVALVPLFKSTDLLTFSKVLKLWAHVVFKIVDDFFHNGSVLVVFDGVEKVSNP